MRRTFSKLKKVLKLKKNKSHKKHKSIKHKKSSRRSRSRSKSRSKSRSRSRKHRKSSDRSKFHPYVDITNYYDHHKIAGDLIPRIVRTGPIVVKPTRRIVDKISEVRVFGLC